tara:strand:+ start:3703 stop:3999 length:297 start_codon:yes stop_codon:yes gene_type:complete
MAIKNRKIPSPIDVKKSSTSFSKEELDKLYSLRDKINQLTFQFGRLKIKQVKLNQEEKTLNSELAQLENQEKAIAESLSKKYGNGTIDLESGTFTPVS